MNPIIITLKHKSHRKVVAHNPTPYHSHLKLPHNHYTTELVRLKVTLFKFNPNMDDNQMYSIMSYNVMGYSIIITTQTPHIFPGIKVFLFVVGELVDFFWSSKGV